MYVRQYLYLVVVQQLVPVPLPLFYFKQFINPNSLDNRGSWRILKDFYCSVTMLRELGLNKLSILFFYCFLFVILFL